MAESPDEVSQPSRRAHHHQGLVLGDGLGLSPHVGSPNGLLHCRAARLGHQGSSHTADLHCQLLTGSNDQHLRVQTRTSTRPRHNCRPSGRLLPALDDFQLIQGPAQSGVL
jgi:hypothetical protein